MRTAKKPIVTITNMYRQHYFQWFILGLFRLQEKGEINLRFRLPFFSEILSQTENHLICRIADKGRRMFERDKYNLKGYIEFQDGNRKNFVIDSADAPYLFDLQDLKTVDIYFKIQFPVDIGEDEFSLTDELKIPWCDHAHVDSRLKKVTNRGERKIIENFTDYREKIKPLIVGPRMLAPKTFSRRALEAGYENYKKDRRVCKIGNLMCYFGNALGPKPEGYTEHPDYDWEADIMGYFGGRVNHPNEKRAVAAELIEKMDNCDARIISDQNADTGHGMKKDMVIPLKDFCIHVAKFKYNLNISGYRLSIPTRFIESFMVGTAVITDKLHVKWYQPFDGEVIETEEMGYLPMDKVDWNKVEKDFNSLSPVNPQKIIDDFDKKWSPEVVAEYIVSTVREA